MLQPFPSHLLQFFGIEEDAQKLDKPPQLCPDPPARPHQIPDVEEPLSHLVQRLLAVTRICFLQKPLPHKTSQLRRYGAGLETRVIGHLHGHHRIPPQRDRVEHLLRLGGQLVHAALVGRRALVEELFQVLAGAPLQAVQHKMEEHHRGARVAPGQLHKGTQASCIGGQPLFHPLPRAPLLARILLHRFAQPKQQLSHFCQSQRRERMNLEELEESAIRPVDPLAGLRRGSEEGQIAPTGEQLTEPPLLPSFNGVEKPVCVVHQEQKTPSHLLAGLGQELRYPFFDFLRAECAQQLGECLYPLQHPAVSEPLHGIREGVHRVEQKAMQPVDVVLLLGERQHQVPAVQLGVILNAVMHALQQSRLSHAPRADDQDVGWALLAEQLHQALVGGLTRMELRERLALAQRQGVVDRHAAEGEPSRFAHPCTSRQYRRNKAERKCTASRRRTRYPSLISRSSNWRSISVRSPSLLTSWLSLSSSVSTLTPSASRQARLRIISQ